MAGDILIVDDEADIRNLIQGILEDEGYKTRHAGSAQETFAAIKKQLPSLIILDIWLQGSDKDGIEILSAVKKDFPDMPVVMISGHGTIETAVNCIKVGAYDFIEKPFKSDRLLLMVRRALETAQLRRENAFLRQKTGGAVDLIGVSAAVENLKHVIERVSATNSRVLLTGEAGSGKDVVARVIHHNSSRADKSFMVLNCATLRPERLEAELFGSVDGIMDEPGRTGVLEQANGSTLLLDEVADMPLETQGKIVRALQEQRFTKLGSTTPIEVDVRIMASTNRDLEQSMKDGEFRQDLYYRLNVVPINMPPLRERAEDIVPLATFFIEDLAKTAGKPPKSFTNQAITVMQNYNWPGNIRQLRNVIEWVMIMHSHIADEQFDVVHLPPEITAISAGGGSGREAVNSNEQINSGAYMHLPLREAREFFEREYLSSQIARFDGNVSQTSRFVGMERSALHRKLKSLQIGVGNNDDAKGAQVQEKTQTADDKKSKQQRA